MLETQHIAHSLEQIVRGYVAGKNTNRWKNTLFADARDNTLPNVEHYFYRFEFQKRGTLHVHVLLWLRDLAAIDLGKVRATIPFSRPDEAFLVADLQTSSKTVLPPNNRPTRVHSTGHQQYIEFTYGPTERAKNIRAYVTTLLGSLHCRVDHKSSDGKGMLLKYVSSYVSRRSRRLSGRELFSQDHATSGARDGAAAHLH